MLAEDADLQSTLAHFRISVPEGFAFDPAQDLAMAAWLKRRITEILDSLIEAALLRAWRAPNNIQMNWEIREAIDARLKQRRDAVLRAASTKGRLISVADEIATRARVLDNEIAAGKRKLHATLRPAKLRLQRLSQKIASFQRWSEMRHRHHSYPAVPPPAVFATEDPDDVPEESGIYFVWARDAVVYVGQSIRLQGRAKLRRDRAIRGGDMLSWLLFPRPLLNYAESYYIGVCRPPRNFGGKYTDDEIAEC